MHEEGEDSGVGIVKLRDNEVVAVWVSDVSNKGGVSLWPNPEPPVSLLVSYLHSSMSRLDEALPVPLMLLLLLPLLLLLLVVSLLPPPPTQTWPSEFDYKDNTWVYVRVGEM